MKKEINRYRDKYDLPIEPMGSSLASLLMLIHVEITLRIFSMIPISYLNLFGAYLMYMFISMVFLHKQYKFPTQASIYLSLMVFLIFFFYQFIALRIIGFLILQGITYLSQETIIAYFI